MRAHSSSGPCRKSEPELGTAGLIHLSGSSCLFLRPPEPGKASWFPVVIKKKRKRGGENEPHPPTHTPGRGQGQQLAHPLLCQPWNKAPKELLGAGQAGGPRPVIGPVPSRGSQPTPHRTGSPATLGSVPGQASEGSSELPRTGPYLFKEPGWRSINKSKHSAGRQKPGNGAPAKGYDFCREHLPQDPPLWEAGLPQDHQPPCIQTHVFPKPSCHQWPKLRWREARRRSNRCGRLPVTADAPIRGRGVDSKHLSSLSCIKIVILPEPVANEKGKEPRTVGVVCSRLKCAGGDGTTEAHRWFLKQPGDL